jgi:hypothetical protein
VKNLSDKLSRLAHLPGRLSAATGQIAAMSGEKDIANLLLGKLLTAHVKSLGPRRPLRDAEFRVYSQWGDDGIIQYLVSQVAVPTDSFVEFGVEHYGEANTRFLLINDNWRGLIMDGSQEFMEHVRNSDLCWRHELTALDAFITRENVNELIAGAGFRGPIGLLSIDIDGNDYWVWQALDVVDPAIVVVEYNSVFGSRRALTVPYDPAFRRSVAHSSHLYWGCSIRALCTLADQKGYVFVGCNSNGNNAYFVKRALAANLTAYSAQEGYVVSRFRESRDANGHLTYLSGDARAAAIGDMVVTDVEQNTTVRLRDALGVGP